MDFLQFMLGRLLRKAPPYLMDALIQASKDGDNSRLLALSGQETWSIEDDEEEEETTYDEEVNYTICALTECRFCPL